MTKEQGRKEIIYQITMNIAYQMFEKGLISKEEYRKYDTKMRQKYDPIIGILFSEIDLL